MLGLFFQFHRILLLFLRVTAKRSRYQGCQETLIDSLLPYAGHERSLAPSGAWAAGIVCGNQLSIFSLYQSLVGSSTDAPKIDPKWSELAFRLRKMGILGHIERNPLVRHGSEPVDLWLLKGN